MKRHLLSIAGTMLVLAAIAYAGTIKTWTSGETLRAADLNANFTHIHTTMVGSHGAKLVDADVAANAAIATSKVVGLSNAIDAGVVLSAQIPQIPKMVLRFGTTDANTACTSTPCTLFVTLPAASATVARSSAGVYVVTFATARANSNYAVIVTSSGGSTVVCDAAGQNTTTVTISCWDPPTAGTPTDAAVNFLLFDDA